MTTFQLLQGAFNGSEALSLVEEFVRVKIRFHENKISETQREEDIKMRESRIKQLQNELATLRQGLISHHGRLALHAEIKFESIN